MCSETCTAHHFAFLEICGFNRKKSCNPICRPKEEKILVPFNGIIWCCIISFLNPFFPALIVIYPKSQAFFANWGHTGWYWITCSSAIIWHQWSFVLFNHHLCKRRFRHLLTVKLYLILVDNFIGWGWGCGRKWQEGDWCSIICRVKGVLSLQILKIPLHEV